MSNSKNSIFTKNYWLDAAESFKNVKMLTIAAVMIALRVIMKMFKIPLAEGLSLSFDCYVNSLGSFIYGPLMALLVGAVSDTIGCIFFPTGPYFFPFVFVEMSSSFIFALFFWHKNITVKRALTAKFTVNLFCNMFLTSLLMKWSYYHFYGLEKASAYNIINLLRIAKSLVMFPFEGLLIAIIIRALIPALQNLKIIRNDIEIKKLKKSDIILCIALLILSVMIILLYIFVLKDFISKNNIKLL